MLAAGYRIARRDLVSPLIMAVEPGSVRPQGGAAKAVTASLVPMMR
jgi:hypothetical protein